MSDRRRTKALLALLLGLALAGNGEAARESKVSLTKHNLSSTGPGSTKSTTESQICVFCHTPHAADTTVPVLWNKTLVSKTYSKYLSSSLDAVQISGRSSEQTALGSSKLCLSCHDGAMALGSVRVLRGATDQIIGGGTEVFMPGSTTTGYTRHLGGESGLDLTNDHPIAITYDTTVATRDGEMRNNSGTNQSWGTVLGKRVKGGQKYVLPLEATGAVTGSEGQVQCTTCHDPHIRDSLASQGNIKFLRANRFQKEQPSNVYSAANDIICLACHDKGMQGNGNSYAYSAHANSQVSTQTYSDAASTTREFPLAALGFQQARIPAGTASNIKVWQASCLNCHDTHTITGANKLLREGASSGVAALEQTCYQCHSTTGATTLSSVATVPNIATAFGLTYRMPVVTAQQGTSNTPTIEVHTIGNNFSNTYVDCSSASNKCGADGVEDRLFLGTTPANRHAECADCHNPHRVVKFQKFYGAAGNITGTPDSSGTHTHTDTSMLHTNVASGVLRGTTGVEPSYSSNSFHASATNYTVRRGDPSNDTVTNDSTPDTKGYVTREYQVCLKCHSTYAYSAPPALRAAGVERGLTPSGTNGLTNYTDQAKEFQGPLGLVAGGHQGEPTSSPNQDRGNDGGAGGGSVADGGTGQFNTKNHRSWHPVMRATGRDLSARGGASVDSWNYPFANVGTQTMYCSDCHGSQIAAGTYSVIPPVTAPPTPWGPHGSDYPFILKGAWSPSNLSTNTDLLCFKCHLRSTYSGSSEKRTGFYLSSVSGDGHKVHRDKIDCCGGSNRFRCSYCHVAVPHGWKNKALLVNLNDVGEEAGFAAGSSKEVSLANTGTYTKAPYYMKAVLKIRSFATSGNWAAGNCGTSSTAKTGSNLITSDGVGGTIADAGTGAAAGSGADGSGNNKTGSGAGWMKPFCETTN